MVAVLFALVSIICTQSVSGMDDVRHYSAIVSVADMRKCAHTIQPERYKEELKKCNLTPQAVAACSRYLIGVEGSEDQDDIDYFNKMKNNDYCCYITTAVEMLYLLRSENNAELSSHMYDYSKRMVLIIRGERDETKKSLKYLKDTEDKIHMVSFVAGGMSALLSIAGGIACIYRLTCVT